MQHRWEALNRILKPEHKQVGFYLEDDEDFLYLKQENRVVAAWNANKAIAETVVAEADRLMAEKWATREGVIIYKEGDEGITAFVPLYFAYFKGRLWPRWLPPDGYPMYHD